MDLAGANGRALSPTVTAAVVTYNRRDLVARAIDSILRQTVAPAEILVVDDGSTDGTADHIEARFGARVRLIRQHNTGVAGARRRALDEAQGDWIAFLDSDDEWTPRRNEMLVQAVEQAPKSVAWIFGDSLIVGDGEVRRLFDEGGLRVEPPLKVYSDPMRTQFPFMFSLLQSSLVRTDTLRETHAFKEGLRSSEDLLASWTVAANHAFAAVPEPVTRVYRTSDLVDSSADMAGKASPDYFRARVLGFDRLARSGRAGSWRGLYAEAVRGWCVRLAADGTGSPLRLALQQFRHGGDLRAAAFLATALLGRRGVNAWSRGRRRAGPSADPAAFKLAEPPRAGR